MAIIKSLEESIKLKQAIAENSELVEIIHNAADAMVESLKSGGQVLFCGNGGSAADAQHLAAELSGRFYYDRDPLSSEALHVNTSYITAVANDYSYNEIYARLIKGKGRKGDVLVGISTSGNSENIVRALKLAQEMGMVTISMTGETGGKMKEFSNFLINVPSKDTPRIQEAHITIGHAMCEIVETEMFPKND